MKKTAFLFWCFGLLPFVQVVAEDLPTMPIAYFAVRCNEIWEAEPLELNNVAAVFWKVNEDDVDWFRVRILKVHRSTFHQEGDTVWVSCGTTYEWPKISSEPEGSWNLSSQDTIQRLWLFGSILTQREQTSNNSWLPVPVGDTYLEIETSGIRLENQKRVVFTPIQESNPGLYKFYNSADSPETNIKWSPSIGSELRLCVERNVRIATDLFSIRAIEHLDEQNDALFSWILKHKLSLTLWHDDPDSWSWYRELPFSWILGNGSDSQAWEAILLYNQFFPDDMIYNSEYTGRLPDSQYQLNQSHNKDQPFDSAEGIALLTNKIKDVSLSPPLRNHAMRLFNQTLQGKLTIENRQSILQNSLKSIQFDTILNRTELIEAVQTLGFWQQNAVHQSLPEAYQFMVNAYQSELPGYGKASLASFLVKKTTADEWKKLNGSDGRILVEVNNFWIDTTLKTLTFQCRQEHGYEQVFTWPKMEMFQLDSKNNPIHLRQISQSNLCNIVDWTRGLKDLELRIVIQLDNTLPKGTWYFRASGKAGQKEEFTWTSELGVCRY
jgi:hypothetical protein